MAGRIQLEIVTPEKRVVADEVDEVVMPGTLGYLGVLPGHAPLLTGLDIGEVTLRNGSEKRYLAVSGGFAEVTRDRVSILADTCEPAEEIDLERAQQAKQRAEAEHEENENAVRLRRAVTRIQVHGRVS
jgi:F-type H+-transporting ATPase subunit epsilon